MNYDLERFEIELREAILLGDCMRFQRALSPPAYYLLHSPPLRPLQRRIFLLAISNLQVDILTLLSLPPHNERFSYDDACRAIQGDALGRVWDDTSTSACIAILDMIIEQTPQYLNDGPEWGGTPLVYAIVKGNAAIVNHLLRKQPSLELAVISFRSRSCIYEAAKMGDVEKVRSLRRYGDEVGRSGALHLACFEGNAAVVEALLSPSSSSSSSSSQDPGRFLEEAAEACVNSLPGHEKDSPLHLAVHSGDPDTVSCLLRHGVTWSGVRDSQGRTAKDLAQELDGERLLSLESAKCSFIISNRDI